MSTRKKLNSDTLILEQCCPVPGHTIHRVAGRFCCSAMQRNEFRRDSILNQFYSPGQLMTSVARRDDFCNCVALAQMLAQYGNDNNTNVVLSRLSQNVHAVRASQLNYMQHVLERSDKVTWRWFKKSPKFITDTAYWKRLFLKLDAPLKESSSASRRAYRSNVILRTMSAAPDNNLAISHDYEADRSIAATLVVSLAELPATAWRIGYGSISRQVISCRDIKIDNAHGYDSDSLLTLSLPFKAWFDIGTRLDMADLLNIVLVRDPAEAEENASKIRFVLNLTRFIAFKTKSLQSADTFKRAELDRLTTRLHELSRSEGVESNAHRFGAGVEYAADSVRQMTGFRMAVRYAINGDANNTPAGLKQFRALALWRMGMRKLVALDNLAAKRNRSSRSS